MDSKSIGLQIKYHRQAAGLTQKELAEKIGTSWEMVSRYETGKSSSLRKLSEISDALNVSPSSLLSSHLEDSSAPYQRNAIPLLTESFTNLDEAISSAKVFYVAPDWITLTCTRPIAIDAGILKIETAKIKPNGIVYVTKEKPSQASDLVVTHDSDSVYVSTNNLTTSSRKFVGTVVAWEQRFR